MPIVKIITLLFLKVKAGEAFGHHSRKEKRISAGAVLSAVRGCGSQPSFFPGGMGVLSDPVSKSGYFKLFRGTRILPTRPKLLSQRLASAAFVRQAARDGKIPVFRDSLGMFNIFAYAFRELDGPEDFSWLWGKTGREKPR